MYLVSIYFDEKTTSRIQGYITQVAKRSGNLVFSGSVFPECAVSFTGFKYLPARTVREGL